MASTKRRRSLESVIKLLGEISEELESRIPEDHREDDPRVLYFKNLDFASDDLRSARISLQRAIYEINQAGLERRRL